MHSILISVAVDIVLFFFPTSLLYTLFMLYVVRDSPVIFIVICRLSLSQNEIRTVEIAFDI